MSGFSLREFDEQQFDNGPGERYYDADVVDKFLEGRVRPALVELMGALNEVLEANPRQQSSQASIKILEKAQEVADNHIAEAQDAAHAIRAEAEAKSAELLEEAQAAYQRTMDEKALISSENASLHDYGLSLKATLSEYVATVSQAVEGYPLTVPEGAADVSEDQEYFEAPIEEVAAEEDAFEAPIEEVAAEEDAFEAPIEEAEFSVEGNTPEEAPEFLTDDFEAVSDDFDAPVGSYDEPELDDAEDAVEISEDDIVEAAAEVYLEESDGEFDLDVDDFDAPSEEGLVEVTSDDEFDASALGISLDEESDTPKYGEGDDFNSDDIKLD